MTKWNAVAVIGRILAAAILLGACSPAFDCVDCRDKPEATEEVAPYVAHTPSEFQDRMRVYDQMEDRMRADDQ
jgi:hypothetical protein